MEDRADKEWDDMEANEARRLTIMGRWFWVTVVIVAVTFLYFLPRMAGAQGSQVDIPVYVIDKDSVLIRLLDKPCVDKASLSQIAPEFHAKFRALDSVWPERDGSRKSYAGCWDELKKGEYGMTEDAFILVFSDGASGIIPKSEAAKKTGLRGA